MLIDGRKIAEEIKEKLRNDIKTGGRKLKLAIIQVGDNEVSKKFIERKVKFAKEIGIETEVYNLPAGISTGELCKKLAEICREKNNGVILQLPLPAHIDTQRALDSIIPEKDVDVLSSRAFGNFTTGRSNVLPPLVGVIKTIFEKYEVESAGKNIVVIGRGILVGKPIANWLIGEGATVSILNSKTKDISGFTKKADIIISGTGKPNLIKPDIVKEGIIAIDGGTAMEDGKLKGDFDPAVAGKAHLFTPVPGGVGPITVAMLLKNLVELSRKN